MALQGMDEWLLVSQDVENAFFEQEPEMEDCQASRQQLSVKSRVSAFCRSE